MLPQVKQSQEHLLERLITYVNNLKPTDLEHLLEEDSEVTQKRAAAQMSIKVRALASRPGCHYIAGSAAMIGARGQCQGGSMTTHRGWWQHDSCCRVLR